MAVAPLASAIGGNQGDVVTVAASGGEVAPLSDGEPVTLSGLIAQTTSTILNTTTTSTTQAPSTTAAPSTTKAPATTAAPTTTTAPTTTHTPPPTTAAPTTSAAPTTTSPPTTAAPSTTAAPAQTHSSERTCQYSENLAYDDPENCRAWDNLAQCESGSNWSINSGNGYYGGLQFSLETWRSVGGSGYPHEHPKWEQIKRGQILQSRSGWGQWPHCSQQLGYS